MHELKIKNSYLTILMLCFSCSLFASQQVNPYLLNRLQLTDKRYPSFNLVLNMLDKRQIKTIIETGTSRNGVAGFEGDGGSTIIFADWALQNGVSFYTVDISPVSIAGSQTALFSLGLDANFVCKDSIGFLRDFKYPIDFLYLDSYDYDFGNPKPSQEHHLREIKAAYKLLHSQSFVMIDDCDLPGGGKGRLVIDFLKERGWKVIYQGYQVVMVRSQSRK